MDLIKKSCLGISVALVGLLFFYNLSLSPARFTHAQSCTVPTQVQNVSITYPNCVDGNCNYTQGNCSWDALTGATGYNVVVTAVGTSTQVLNQQAITPISSIFTVSASDTYRCDVSAVNACGTGAIGTSSLLCNTELVPTTTTTTTTTVPAPTTITVPQPTLPPPGSNAFILGFAGILMIIISFSLFLI